MKTNSQLVGTSSSAPVVAVGEGERLQVAVAARRRRPRCGSRTSTLSAAAIRSTRYSDIVSSRRAAADQHAPPAWRSRAKLSTAWPAELAAPTTYTSSPSHCAASLAEAP